MTAPRDKGGNVPPESKYEKQRSCKHRFEPWYTPHWDPGHKYRTCTNCEFVEVKYV